MLREQIMNEANLFAIHTLNKIKNKPINYNLLDNMCRKYSIPIFRYKDKCLVSHNNTEGDTNSNSDIALWMKELGYEYSDKEEARQQNMSEVKNKLEKELLKQESNFLKKHCTGIPEFSLKHFSYALIYLLLLVSIILKIILIFSA